MKTTHQKIKVKDVFNGYQDKNWDGVVGYDGKLDIRPIYQREFIYSPENERAVIDTILKEHPLNLVYWVKNGDNFEVLDGQQRTLSICRFLDHKYHIELNGEKRYCDTLLKENLDKINNYELDVYICEGTEGEILEWFKTINIKGKELNNQELLNATHTGTWLTDAKRYFSKPNCAAKGLGEDYISASVERQEFLETALKWINNGDAQGYMAFHRNDENAKKLQDYFANVIEWIGKTFTTYRREMKNVNWGELYNQFKDAKLDATKLEKEIVELLEDEEVGNQKGIYDYVLTKNERSLNLRIFDDKTKRRIYEKQKGICPLCKGENKKKKWKLEEMEADHIRPWHEGGKTISENCQMLCKEDNRTKSGK
jgi:hypothetical protein